MKKSAFLVLAILIAIGMLISFTPKESHALTFDGSEFVSGTSVFSGSTVEALVSYAVYGPGVVNPYKMTAGEYTYVYEIINSAGVVTHVASSLTIGMRDIGLYTIGSAGSISVPFAALCGLCESDSGTSVPHDADPVFINQTPTSVVYNFASPDIAIESDTRALFFTSVFAPGTISATIIDGGLSASAPLPSPVPEPASLILMGSGLAGLALWGRKKKIADKG